MYNVAFRYTKEAGGYHGVIFWTSYSNKEEFNKLFTDEMKKKMEVVEEGITEERAIELTRTTPVACRVAAKIQDAAGECGEIDLDLLVVGLKTVILSENLSKKSDA